MKAALIYDSRTGNTALLANVVRSLFEIVSDIAACDLVFVGSWTDKGFPSPAIQQQCQALRNKKIFYFATCGFGGSQEYYEQLYQKAASLFDPSNQMIGHYICQGKMPMSVRKRYESLYVQQPDHRSILMQINNFDRALSHPNEEDLAAFRHCIRQSLSST